MSRTRRAGALTLVTAGVVTFSTGTALGYFTTGITGTTVTASAEGGTVTLHAEAAPSAALYPGGPAADVTVTVTNPFSAPVSVSTLTATATGCTTPDLQVGQPAELPLTVPAKATVTQRLTSAVRLGTSASDDCQGAALAVTYVVTGRL